MNRHILTTDQPAKATPAKILPDGLITGNGDLTVTLGGTADRVRIFIGKADFWKADELRDIEYIGGISPLGLVEILLPHLAYAEYRAEQDMDGAQLRLYLKDGSCTANLKITVCATENTVLFELERSFPAVSASVSLVPLDGWGAVCETGTVGDVQFTLRGFDSPESRFPSYGVCALRRISGKIANGRESAVWAMTAATNHDTAAYRHQAIEKVGMMKPDDCQKLLAAHTDWWKTFWGKAAWSWRTNNWNYTGMPVSMRWPAV